MLHFIEMIYAFQRRYVELYFLTYKFDKLLECTDFMVSLKVIFPGCTCYQKRDSGAYLDSPGKQEGIFPFLIFYKKSINPGYQSCGKEEASQRY